MATTTSTISRLRQSVKDESRPAKRKKEERKDIWSSLLRQTRDAQARNSSSQSLARRSLVLCGGNADDQQAFLQSLTRPPPPPPPGRRGERQDAGKEAKKGQVKLSNRYAYGYGHVTLFSSPGANGSTAGGLGGLGQEAEEVARIECHTIPEARGEYEGTLRRLLTTNHDSQGQDIEIDEMTGLPKSTDRDLGEEGENQNEPSQRIPAICILLSWRAPWNFLSELRAWYQLIARSLLPPGARDENSAEVIREFAVKISVVVQHTEAQETLEREGWKEDKFDYVSQHLRTVLLPLNAAIIFTSSATLPQQPGAPLSDVQKVLFTSLGMDLSSISPPLGRTVGNVPARKEDLLPKHNVVDRMAICVPSGWDSAGKIRLLSETFSPEEVLTAWQNDLETLSPSLQRNSSEDNDRNASQGAQESEAQANAGAQAVPSESESRRQSRQQEEVYGTASPSASPVLQPISADLPSLPPNSTTKSLPSTLSTYNSQITDLNAHRVPLTPTITTTYTPEQTFLSEMKTHLDTLAAQDVEKSKSHPSRPATSTTGLGRMAGTPAGDASGALDALGEVSFNVGGVNYNTASAEAAIANLKRPQGLGRSGTGGDSNATGSPRAGTPRPPGREREKTPGSNGGKKEEMPVEDLAKYFASLVKKTGGSGSGSPSSTPTRH